jgi:L-2-hydroxyglutarate oxidase LhgO
MSAADIDAVVIGAGVVGLAIARSLARSGLGVLVLEASERAGEGVSSRNSGVIHAGLYYPTGSLRARLCVRGRELLYAYCAERGVAHRRLGKLVVAVNEAERPALLALHARGIANGVPLAWLEADAVRALEPELRCVAALDSPTSGIVDVPELILALEGEIGQLGGQVLCHTPVVRIARAGALWRVQSVGGDAITCHKVVNAAGHGALALAACTEGIDLSTLPRAHYGQGHYYGLRGRAPFRRLIYPLPGPASLGVHLGMDLSGRARFGPDLRWVDGLDYRFDDARRAEFAEAIRQWWPALADEDLQPDFVGVRPKIHGPGEAQPDFRIDDEGVHGLPGVVQLYGIESPGLTSALAIGEDVARRLGLAAAG